VFGDGAQPDRYGVIVGLWDAIVRNLSSGSERSVNNDEQVELMTVPLFDGPLVVAELRNSGIDAQAIDSFNIVTEIASNARILVRRGDLDAARAVVADRFSHEIE
jgi:hypothetical protein